VAADASLPGVVGRAAAFLGIDDGCLSGCGRCRAFAIRIDRDVSHHLAGGDHRPEPLFGLSRIPLDPNGAGGVLPPCKVLGPHFFLNVAIGVVTGIPLEFEFGTNWREFARAGGDFFGHMLGYEAAMAFMRRPASSGS
jgi:hypothetical protein